MADVVSEAVPLPVHGSHAAEIEKTSLHNVTTTGVDGNEDIETKVEKTAQALLAEPKASTHPRSTLQLEDRYIDEPRPLRVAVIGAGIAGITAGVLFPAKVPGIQLTIFEKNADVGGTWYENVYPGVRCDLPSHVYQSTFEPNVKWSEEFAQGAEIRDYWQGIARKYNVYKYLKLSHKTEDLNWDENKSVWNVSVRDLKSGTSSTQKFDAVVLAIGRFNTWKLPDYPGLDEYKGVLRHASNWDSSFNPDGKKIAVIGNGASGIQLVANIQKHVAHLDHYARNKTWIAASFGGDETSITPKRYTEEQLSSFEDPDTYLKFRKEAENKYWRQFDTFLLGSEENAKARESFLQILKERLVKKPELIDKLIPDFSPHCRRLTPGPGYLEAITEDNVDYIQTPIKRFTETGIETTDGVQRDVDAIFCATGAQIDLRPPFSIKANGKDLRDLWDKDGELGFPYSYLGVATPGFPNLLFIHGPYGAGRSGTVPFSIETQTAFQARVLRKISREGIKTIVPSKQAADDFIDYADSFFNTTVLSENCSSWYNSGVPGGRIHGMWPGSAAHHSVALREPRWEDWEYTYLSDTGNRFLWYFGRGRTKKEADPSADMTTYLKKPGEVRPYDIRDLHEGWWRIP